MKLKITGFDWDDGNWPKCGKHRVSREEIEQVLLGTPAVMKAYRGCRKSLIITHKSGRLRAHPFAQFVIAAQAAIQWRVRAFYICAAQAQQDVFIAQKKSALDRPSHPEGTEVPLDSCLRRNDEARARGVTCLPLE